MVTRVEERDQEIIATVIGILETEGYDAVQVRRVAEEASISLSTLYKLYGSRDELIIRAVEQWMQDNAYAGLEDVPTDGTPVQAISRIVHAVYAPWQHQPHMLAAFVRARLSPGGKRLDQQGFAAVVPLAAEVLTDVDPELVADATVILEHVNLAVLQRFAAGELAVDEIIPIYERTLRRVLPDDAETPRATRQRRRSRR